MKDWYEESFGEDYLLVYKHRSIENANQEVKRMTSWLHLPQGARILDLCCGTGRHSLALAAAGYDVTGVDLSEVLLREAHKLDTKQQVQWKQSDMRKLPLDGGFDAVLNLFTSFGYFREDEEQMKVLHEMYRVMKPGGRFIIDFMNSTFVRTHLVPESTREDEDQQIQEHRKIEEGFVKKDIRITALDGEGQERHYKERVKLYTYEELQGMLEAAGLVIDEVHGGYEDQANYEEDSSKRMIFIGHRRAHS